MSIVGKLMASSGRYMLGCVYDDDAEEEEAGEESDESDMDALVESTGFESKAELNRDGYEEDMMVVLLLRSLSLSVAE